MKKLASYFFLLVFLFNVGGYYIVFWGLHNQAKKNLLQRLDANNYAHDDVVVLTVPISLPYPIYQNGYQRVDGEFEYKGESFKLVKQKLENDTLFLVCIRDKEAKKINSVMADFSKLANNIPAGSKQALNFLGKLFKDFNTSQFFQLKSGEKLLQEVYYTSYHEVLLQQTYPIDAPPPEVLS